MIIILSFIFAINLSANDELKIASFNIQVFGNSKISKPMIKENLVKIITRYDIVFVQEIRASDDYAIKKLLNEINSKSDEKYDFIISERLGSSSSKEQYAYIYKKAKIDVIDTFQYKISNDFERSPFAVKLKYKSFVFSLVGIHVDPDKVRKEIDNLNAVLKFAERKFSSENIILLGDMNAGCKYINPHNLENSLLRRNSDYNWLIDDFADTTVKKTNCAYDRIIANNRLSNNIKNVGVFRFDQEFKISKNDALKISDHYPVEFQLKIK